MAILYTKRRPQKSIALGSNVGRMADELAHTGNGWVNIVNDFPWTLTNTQAALRETPFIQLNEYYMIQSALNQQLLPYGIDTSGLYGGGLGDLMTIAGSMFDADTIKLYEGIFDLIAPTGFKYRIPLFSQQQYSASNTWERKDIMDTIINFQKAGLGFFGKMWGGLAGAGQSLNIPKMGQAIAGGAETVTNAMQAVPDIMKQIALLKLQTQNPGVGLSDPPQLFQGAAPREYQLSFYLFNTESKTTKNIDIEQIILRNWEVCYMLTYQNSFNKRNFFTNSPPVFYEVYIPGVHYCKASVMKAINISNVGNVRNMQLPIDGGARTPVNIPDAYKIDIAMQDILMPSKNLLEAVIDARYQDNIRGQ